MKNQPKFRGIYLFVSDIKKTAIFYALLGLEVEVISEMYARAVFNEHLVLEFGTSDLTLSYDPEWLRPDPPSTGTLGFEFEADETIDLVFERIIKAGYKSHLAPCTPPWQSRFAIIIDPDGNYVGLHGPRG